MQVTLPVSLGEFFDKVSILRIKREKITNPAKLDAINAELAALEPKLTDFDGHEELLDELFEVNSKLWVIEDDIRLKEARSEFDAEFVELARSVYFTNDQRFAVKNKVNERYGSAYKEQKELPTYQ